MYILSSTVSDNDAPSIAAEIVDFIRQESGTVIAEETLGKKKLAYPIKKTRNGFYVLQTFNLQGSKLTPLDNKLRSLKSIIRYLVVNLEDAEKRKAKDFEIQQKMKAARKPPKAVPVATPVRVALSEKELEEKIESALESEDLAK